MSAGFKEAFLSRCLIQSPVADLLCGQHFVRQELDCTGSFTMFQRFISNTDFLSDYSLTERRFTSTHQIVAQIHSKGMYRLQSQTGWSTR